MGIQLVPYNNAMRLGQGFNSYSQQICIDDAVKIDPERAENVITNDGTTMRILSEKNATPSAWNRQPEVVTDDRAGTQRRNGADEGPKDGKLTAKGKEGPDAKDNKQPTVSGKKDPGEGKEALADNDKGQKAILEKTAVESDLSSTKPNGAGEAVGPLDESAPAAKKISAPSKVAGKSTASQPGEKPDDAATKAVERSTKSEPTPKKKDVQESVAVKKQDEDRRKREEKRIEDQRKYQEEIERDARDDERDRRKADREEQKIIRAEKAKYETARRVAINEAISKAANVRSESLEDLKKIAAQNQFAERFTGIFENTQKHSFDATAPRGPSQTVSYTSRFVDRLSDITEDMCISGSLSIKAGKIGGSGKGSFVDSDKFKESDMNFYISVKVVNQTINFKDALVYNPVKSLGKASSSDFQKIFGDSFISGFVEGGEFNALVSMKILNKAKKTDIQAEAKVALTAGPVDIEAEAKVGIARSNLQTNTETTIQVSWSGGGHIKPMEQQWDIASMMQAAARFPDLVADCPQRTYAILTKYDTLRSFVALKPEAYTPLQYENAQIYTNALMDAFMSYKSLYKRLGEQIFGVQGKILEIKAWNETKDDKGEDDKRIQAFVKDLSKANDNSVLDEERFDDSVKGLSKARDMIRKQMVRIVNEVDVIENDPKKATAEDREEPFQSPLVFESRIPSIQIPERLKPSESPLTGRPIQAKQLTEAEQKEAARQEEERNNAPYLYNSVNKLSKVDEIPILDKIRNEQPGIGSHIRVTDPVGSGNKGRPFNNVEILKADWVIDSIEFNTHEGQISYVGVTYENGLVIGKGPQHNKATSYFLKKFRAGERIISASLETGLRSGEQEKRLLAIGLFTNYGRSLLASVPTSVQPDGKYKKDNLMFEAIEVTHFDAPIDNFTLKGFFGRSDEDLNNGAIWRLGIIWSRSTTTASTKADTTPLALSSISPMVPETVGPQHGSHEPKAWKNDNPNCVAREEITFNPAYLESPLFISGVSLLDAPKAKPFHIDIRHTAVGCDKATCVFRTIGSAIFKLKLSWLSIPRTDKHIETGIYETVGGEEVTQKPDTGVGPKVVIPFSKPFRNPPRCSVWLCKTSSSMDAYIFWASADAVTTEGFTLSILRHHKSGTGIDGLRVGWLAFDPIECPNIQSGNIQVTNPKAQPQFIGREKFISSFKTTPSIFLAQQHFQSGNGTNLRLSGQVTGIKKDGFDYELGTWTGNDNDLVNYSFCWIAVV